MSAVKNAAPKPGQAKIIKKLKAAMAARQYSQSAMSRLAAEAGAKIHQTKFSKWVGATSQRVTPEFQYLPILAEILRVPLAYLADDRREIAEDLKSLELELQVEGLINRLGIQATYDRLTMQPQSLGGLTVSGGIGVSGEEVERRERQVEESPIGKRKKAGRSA